MVRACQICDKEIRTGEEYIDARLFLDGRPAKGKFPAAYCVKCWGRILTPYLRSKI